jgi:hypothetical protein
VLAERGWKHLGITPPLGVQPMLDFLTEDE